MEKFQGQAGFNADKYELELDIYGQTDAVLTVGLVMYHAKYL